MKPIYVYPASFCPPTFGHLHTATKAAELFSKVKLICSVNPGKTQRWFTPEERQILWQSYNLPTNITVETLKVLLKLTCLK
ncbi:MAG: hypothetical protein COV55_02685 [Candidatus Komeilibacteria bacterium CG11_big_fil_rev_8_21_14_0_20_36_20]|uniref:Phosphopantetheine adenylyltransferase n=1 Tax=Candidatus Komeilibacteria bacterium CG11_big_fil_rev_8_21_14_0_20_36_20 TaxID=1974477 RepID=A0A2H0NEX6_9BACT|nr:MAG: hypothetical protein COV55_02685 [Candidatus Komeilibacteria bacterium CG11_big_fil_rev_8_21_14_0_20_36_20]PIR81491.1 MAG: hypothetical protein COU21_03225 [Candidatus Komeilibacteria bacterium CG10_big_fil_rev_8_21_14_0_10_36_65]PJC55733.1 MAG: hypothetical protein CO027_00595 [Candidatus Komeilibacteria bacterium CG_4_9_14_0_2_um_filter_36_13]